MSEKIKCMGCNKYLKEVDINLKVGDKVIVDRNLTNLINSGVVLPFCINCKKNLLDDF